MSEQPNIRSIMRVGVNAGDASGGNVRPHSGAHLISCWSVLSASCDGERVVGYNDNGAITAMIGDNCVVLSTTDRLVTVIGFESA